jgi:hypothetical protein
MADDDNDARAHERAAEPAPDLEGLGSRLVGTWEISGNVRGMVTYEWMEGGFFLVQGVDLVRRTVTRSRESRSSVTSGRSVPS